MHFVIYNFKNEKFSSLSLSIIDLRSEVKSLSSIFVRWVSVHLLLQPTSVTSSCAPGINQHLCWPLGSKSGMTEKGPSSPGSLLSMLMLWHILRMKICESLQLPILMPLLSMSTGTAVSIFISICCIYILLPDKTTFLFIHRTPEWVELEVVNYSFPRVSVYSISGSILRTGLQFLWVLLDLSIFWYYLVHMEENYHPQSSPYMPSALDKGIICLPTL